MGNYRACNRTTSRAMTTLAGMRERLLATSTTHGKAIGRYLYTYKHIYIYIYVYKRDGRSGIYKLQSIIQILYKH